MVLESLEDQEVSLGDPQCPASRCIFHYCSNILDVKCALRFQAISPILVGPDDVVDGPDDVDVLFAFAGYVVDMCRKSEAVVYVIPRNLFSLTVFTTCEPASNFESHFRSFDDVEKTIALVLYSFTFIFHIVAQSIILFISC